MKSDPKAFLVLPIVVLIGVAIAWAGSQGGATFRGIPVFALAVALVFLIQWLAFIPAYLTQSERFFDLTGSLTYISVTVLAAWMSAPIHAGRSCSWSWWSCGRRASACSCSAESGRRARTTGSTRSSPRSSDSSTCGPSRRSG